MNDYCPVADSIDRYTDEPECPECPKCFSAMTEHGNLLACDECDHTEWKGDSDE